MVTQTSGNFSLTTNRDAIITRALRIIGAVGQGETAASTAITEASEALNDLVKEWQADGMPLWSIRQFKIPLTSGVSTYVITDGPLKVFQCWNHDSSLGNDSPTLLITRHQYQMLSAKTTPGTPSQVWYDPPGNPTESYGTVTMYPVPDSHAALYTSVNFSGQKPFETFNASTDVPDFPSYWNNAIKWGLADQLAYEYGVGITVRSMITKKALYHKNEALGFGTEEGSLLIQPMPSWNWEQY